MDAGEERLLELANGTLEDSWKATGVGKLFAWDMGRLTPARQGYVNLASTWLEGVRIHLKQGGSVGQELKDKVTLILGRQLRLVNEGYGSAYPLTEQLLTAVGLPPDKAKLLVDDLWEKIKRSATVGGLVLAGVVGLAYLLRRR